MQEFKKEEILNRRFVTRLRLQLVQKQLVKKSLQKKFHGTHYAYIWHVL